MAAQEDTNGRRRSDYDPHAAQQTIHLLAVDDDPAYLRRIRLVLERAGFEVHTAHDGAAALDKLRADRSIEILLIDLKMPGLDGIETVRQLRAEALKPGIYTVLLTSSDGTDVKLRALDNGLDDFLSKASSDAEIVAKLRSAARRLEMERRLHLENVELQTLALTDELTGIANRRALFRAAESILAAGRTLSVVLFDVDRFKAINDTHGHLMGDRILTDVASLFKAHTRVVDIIARYGGDEFVLLLPDTGRAEATSIASRLRAIVGATCWELADATVFVKLTFGVASSAGHPQTNLAALLATCDEALYRRKREFVEGGLSERRALDVIR
jgi:diguanylate cyclase (GGDEF)-like protein